MRKLREQLAYEWYILTKWQRVAEVLKFAAVLALAWVCFGLMGCATTDPQDGVREYNAQIDRENWDACDRLYRFHGVPTVHRGHLHSEQARVRLHWIQQDLVDNRCERLLGARWADKI
jgi:hypothetical protein